MGSVVHALIVAQLHRFTATSDIVYGAVLDRETDSGLRPVLPVRVTVDGGTRLDELIASIDRSLREQSCAGPAAATDIAAWIGQPADEPLFTAVIAAGPAAERDARPPRTALPPAAQATGCVIGFEFGHDVEAGCAELRVGFDTARLAVGDIRLLADGLVAMTGEATRPDQAAATVGELLHRTWRNGAAAARGRGQGRELAGLPADVLARFDAAAARAPDDIAVRDGALACSYAQLDHDSRAVGAALRAPGIGQGATVAIRMKHSVSLVTAIMGVLRAGAAFVPVDIRHADLRTARLLRLAGTGLVVHDTDEVPEGFPLAVEVAELLAEGQALDPRQAGLPVIGPEAAAYVIFTSGSTGEPKAVQISRRALAGYVDWAVAAYLRFAQRGAPLFSSIAFDLTLTSVFAPLAAGQPVHIVEIERGINAVAAMLARGMSFAFVKLTPSHLRLLVAALEEIPAAGSVGCLVVGGEQLPSDLVRAWRKLSPDTVVINEYGPTEATIGCVVHEISPCEPVPSAVPIGLPVPGALLRVLDERGDPVPDGVPGELYIGGPCLADGYLTRPDLTAERFVDDPLARALSVLYRTGDLVRWQPDGVLAYLGRNDEQIKIRGYRIEPTEVESAIRECGGVTDCVVTCWRRDADDVRLVAHVVARPDVTPADLIPTIADYLRGRLPEYLIPAHFMPAAHIPHTSNGKVDRRNLPFPDDPPELTVRRTSHA